jgi:cephalosporin hydroxylase
MKRFIIPKNSNATKKDYEHFEQMNRKAEQLSNNQLETLSSLTAISKNYKEITDKGPDSEYWRKHCYTEFYGPLLSHLRHEKLDILEIGVRWGGSLLMWSDYFPNAKITGVDINLNQMSDKTKKEVDKRGIKTILGNAYSPDFYKENFSSKSYDIILDDGSHYESDQISFFDLYKDSLKQGGYLMSEDFHSPQQAKNVINNFKGRINNMSLIIRNHCVPSGKGEIIVMFKEDVTILKNIFS